MKNSTRIILLLLSLVLLVGALVMTVGAQIADPRVVAIVYDGSGNEKTTIMGQNETEAAGVTALNDYFCSSAVPGDRIVLQRDLTACEGIKFNALVDDVIFDLGGHTITAAQTLTHRQTGVNENGPALFWNQHVSYCESIDSVGYVSSAVPADGIQFTICNGTVNTGTHTLFSQPDGWGKSVDYFSDNVADGLGHASANGTRYTFKNLKINSAAASASSSSSATSGDFIYYEFGEIVFDGCDVTLTGNSGRNAFIRPKCTAHYDVKLTIKNSSFYAPNASSVVNTPEIEDVTNNEQPFFAAMNTAAKYDDSGNARVTFSFSNSSFVTAGSFIAPLSGSDATFTADNCYIKLDCPNSSGAVLGDWNTTAKGTYTFNNCDIAYSFRFVSVKSPTLVTYLNGCDVTCLPKRFWQESRLTADQAPLYADGSCRFIFNSNSYEAPVGGAVVFAHFDEGVRTNIDLTANKGIEIPDGCSYIFDPAGDAEFPYVISSVAVNDPSTGKIVESFSGPSLHMFTPATVTFDGSTYTTNYDSVDEIGAHFHQQSIGSANTILYDSVPNTLLLTLSDTKHGKVETPNIGGNSYFKYTVLSPKDASGDDLNQKGDAVKFGFDATHVFGSDWKYSTYEVFTIDFRIMADSEYGFSETGLYIKFGRTVDATENSAMVRIANDGALSVNGSGVTVYSSSRRLATDEWSHISISMDRATNRAYWYINSVLYCEMPISSGTNDDSVFRGIGLETLKDANQVIGSSYAIDNLIIRVYNTNYDGSESAGITVDNVTKFNYDNDVTFSNENVTVNRKPYHSFDEALDWALEIGDEVVIDNKVTIGKIDTVGAVVRLNDADARLVFNSESLPAYFDANSLTYVFSNDKALEEPIRVVMPSGSTTQVKAGHSLPIYYYDGNYRYEAQGTADCGAVYAGMPLSTAIYDAYKGQNKPITVSAINSHSANAEALAYKVTDSQGVTVDGGIDSFDLVRTSRMMNDGYTITLLRDMVFYASEEVYIQNETGTRLTIGFDLAGHKLIVPKKQVLFNIGSNIEFNVYSSVEGGEIDSRSMDPIEYANGSASTIVNGVPSVYHSWGALVFAVRGNNTTLNLGAYIPKNIPGYNLTVNACVVSDVQDGTNVVVNVDGGTYNRYYSDSTALFMSRNTATDCVYNIKNANLFSTTAKSMTSQLFFAKDNSLAQFYVDNCLLYNTASDLGDPDAADVDSKKELGRYAPLVADLGDISANPACADNKVVLTNNMIINYALNLYDITPEEINGTVTTQYYGKPPMLGQGLWSTYRRSIDRVYIGTGNITNLYFPTKDYTGHSGSEIPTYMSGVIVDPMNSETTSVNALLKLVKDGKESAITTMNYSRVYMETGSSETPTTYYYYYNSKGELALITTGLRYEEIAADIAANANGTSVQKQISRSRVYYDPYGLFASDGSSTSLMDDNYTVKTATYAGALLYTEADYMSVDIINTALASTATIDGTSNTDTLVQVTKSSEDEQLVFWKYTDKEGVTTTSWRAYPFKTSRVEVLGNESGIGAVPSVPQYYAELYNVVYSVTHEGNGVYKIQDEKVKTAFDVKTGVILTDTFNFGIYISASALEHAALKSATINGVEINPDDYTLTKIEGKKGFYLKIEKQASALEIGKNDNLAIRISYELAEPIWNAAKGEYKTEQAATLNISFAKYATNILKDDQTDNVEIEVASAKMMVEMLNYIVMVNRLANPGYETPATIAETIEAYNKEGIKANNVDLSSTEFPSAPDAIKNVIVATATNLNDKDGSAKLRFYIRADQNYGITLSYTDVSTKAQTTINIASANLAQNGTVEIEGVTCYYYDLPLRMFNFNQDITIAVDGISESYTYNFGSYVKALNASDESAEVKSAISSLYAYADKSREYVLVKGGEIDPDDGYVPPEWNQQTVIFVADGATHHTANVPHGDTVTMPGNPTKEGYTFAGWYTDNGTFNNAFTQATPVTDNITVYAKFTLNSYTVNFVVNGEAHGEETVSHGDTVTLPNVSQDGYTFDGWYTNSGLTDKFIESTPITSSITLYAKTTLNSYSITLYYNNQFWKTISATHGSTLSQRVDNPSTEGHTFSGWFKNSDLTDKFDENTTPITSDLTLYSKLEANKVSVTFKAEGQADIVKDTTYGSTVQLPGDPIKDGYTFGGWFMDNGTQFTSSTPVTSNITVTALFTVNTYTVTFLDAAGGTHYSVQVEYDKTVTSLPGGPTKTGHTFSAWYANSGLTTAFTTSTKITGNTTVYPKFTANKYTVTFLNASGGTHHSVQVEYDKTVTSLPGGPTKTGHTFAGWFSNSGLTTSFTTSTKITGNTTVYPKFNVNSYTVYFYVGSTLYTSKTASYGSTVTVTAPTKAAHDFAGWYTNEALTTAFNGVVPANNINVYAKFTQKQNLRILFIGNSLTYYNDMPEIFEALAKAGGKTLTVESVTKGSSTMKEQITSSTDIGAKVAEKLKQQWDYVIIQPSRRITNQESTVKNAELSAVVTLNNMIKAAGAQAIIYGTFGNNNNSVGIYKMDADGIYASKNGTWAANFSTHNNYMIGVNQEFANKIGAPLVNVANMYAYAVANYSSSVDMFHTDERHPSLIGSYAIACAFYAHFYNQSPEAAAASYTNGLTASAAKFAAQLAAKNAGLISSITATPSGSTSGNAGQSTITYAPVQPSTDSSGRYLIASPGNFVWLQQQSAAGNSFAGVSIQQTADINLGGGNLIPIGLTTPFQGTYDAKGHTLSNFAVTVDGEGEAGSAGIFAKTNGARIVGLRVENVTIKGTWAGGIVGYAIDTEIRDCVIDQSSSVEGAARVGGIVGFATSTTTSGSDPLAKINYCVNRASVYSIMVKNGSIYVGGIVGVIQDCNIAYCFNKGDVSVSSKEGNSNACGGGIVGLDSTSSSKYNSTIKYCVNEGVVLFDNSGSNATTRPYLGGIIGRAANGSASKTYTVKIQYCYNLGSFVLAVPSSSNWGMGQLCGVFATPGKVTFTACYGLDTVHTQLNSTYSASAGGGSTSFLAGKEGGDFTAAQMYSTVAAGQIGTKTAAEIRALIKTFVLDREAQVSKGSLTLSAWNKEIKSSNYS